MSIGSGLVTIPGVAAADTSTGSDNQQESPIDTTIETFKMDGEFVSLAVAEHSETGEEAATISRVAESDEQLSSQGGSGENLEISTTQVEDPDIVRDMIARKRETGELVDADEEKYGGVVSADEEKHGGIEGVIEDLPTEAEDYVTRAQWYVKYIGDCDAEAFDVDEHLMVGATIEWTDFAHDIMSQVIFSTIIGGLLGAIFGAALCGIPSGGPGAAVCTPIGTLCGGVVGGFAGLVWEHFKDSRYMTMTFMDMDICGFGACGPGSKLVGSGRWDDRSEEMGAFCYLPTHVEDYDKLEAMVTSSGVVPPGPASIPTYQSKFEVIQWFLNESIEAAWPTDSAPTDPDGDGLYEDLNGDGEINFPDVNELFQNTDTDMIQGNTEMFDYTGDSSVDLQDVLALFEMV